MVRDLAYEKHCNFILGSYAESQWDRKITNKIEELTVSGICLYPTIKFQVSYKIFSLKTRRQFTHK